MDRASLNARTGLSHGLLQAELTPDRPTPSSPGAIPDTQCSVTLGQAGAPAQRRPWELLKVRVHVFPHGEGTGWAGLPPLPGSRPPRPIHTKCLGTFPEIPAGVPKPPCSFVGLTMRGTNEELHALLSLSCSQTSSHLLSCPRSCLVEDSHMLPCPASDPHTHPRGVSFLTETQQREKYEKVKKMHGCPDADCENRLGRHTAALGTAG